MGLLKSQGLSPQTMNKDKKGCSVFNDTQCEVLLGAVYSSIHLADKAVRGTVGEAE